MKVGLALGSGGARGVAHLGVLEVLEKEGIPIDYIVGSSSGAVMGTMYAFSPKVAPNLTRIRNYLHSELYDNTKLMYFSQNEANRKNLYDKLKVKFAQGAVFAASLAKPALFNEEVLKKNVEFLISAVNIEDSLIELAVVAFDINTGEEVLIQSGDAVSAVMASSAIPGVFPPIKKEENLLMDGGFINPVPCNHARTLGADVVIGVDLNLYPDPFMTMTNSYDIAMRAADISRIHLKQHVAKYADFMIPVDVGKVFWGDFSKTEECVEIGRQAAKQSLPQIKKILKEFEAKEKTS